MFDTKGILSCIGETPLIHLENFFSESPFQLYAKMEAFNPGGSLKDRPAIKMIRAALHAGDIDANTTIIESSSGNLGIGLAQACAYWGLKFICVTDKRCTEVNRKIIKAYGAQLEIIMEPDPVTGDLLAARLNRIEYLLQTIPNSFNCNQYRNLNNPAAHFATMDEVLDTLNGNVDYIFCATSTCGTLRGCSEYIAKKGLSTKVIAVDAIGSIIFGDTPKKRLLPGHGAGVMPPHYRPGLEDRHILVSDLECVTNCRKLILQEAVFVGGSAGAVMAGIDRMKHEIPAGAVCVAIMPDRGERYLETIYSDDWVMEHFGEVSHLWNTAVGEYAAMEMAD